VALEKIIDKNDIVLGSTDKEDKPAKEGEKQSSEYCD